jgi:hypothetical protein
MQAPGQVVGRSAARRSRLWTIGLLTAAAGILAAVLFWFDPSRYGFYPVCAFHRTTGLLCPGCGASRAVHELLHGNLIAAMHFNAFFVCSLPVFGWLSVRYAVSRFRNQPVAFEVRPFWLWSILVAVVIFGIARNLPFAHAAWLAP